MSSKVQNKGVPFFGDFLDYLRLHKFRVSVVHYARVQQVFDHVGDKLRPDDDPKYLKSLLCPIFAVNDAEQHKFSNLYDEYIEHCRKTSRKAKFERDGDRHVTRHKDPGSLYGPREVLRDRLNGLRRKLSPGSIMAIALAGLTLSAVVYVAVHYLRSPGQQHSVPVVTEPTPLLRPTPQPSQTPRTSPSPPPSPTPTPPEQKPPALFYGVVALALLALLLLYALFRKVLRAIDSRNYENKRPPFKWPLHILPPAVRLYESEEFRRAARLLRKRQVDEFFRVDIRATISATIRSLGYPTFRYRPATRVPEYLALIERASPHDHQAHLFDEMVRALRHQGVIVTRYFYGDDPLVCCDESGENCIRLERLKHRHAGHRLLLFGSGENLLDPVTGRLAEWTILFSNWHERAILTPESNWGWREHVLLEKFAVVSISANGLVTLVDQFESPASKSSMGWPLGDPRPLPLETDLSDLDAVRDYLGPELFQWLCACAIYTELRWALTLLLGPFGRTAQRALNEESLLRLFRLPWFRKGSIPDAERARLIEALAADRLEQTRKVIIDLLENSPPPTDTFASNAHSLELALQRWLIRKDKKTLSELRNALRRMPSRQISRSQVLTQSLKPVPHKLFGGALPDVCYRRGLPALGLSTLTQALLVAIVIALSLGVLRARAQALPQWLYAPFASAATTPEATPSPTPTNTPPATASPTPLTSPTPGVSPAPPTSPTPGVSPAPPTSPTPGVSPAPPPSTGNIYSGEIEDEASLDSMVSEEIEPALKKNPKSIIYLVSADTDAAETIQNRITEEYRDVTEEYLDVFANIIILKSCDQNAWEVDLIIKSVNAAPPDVPKCQTPALALPKSARWIGEFNYLFGLDDTRREFGDLTKLTLSLSKNPKAVGYLVVNLSNGRLGENRFDIWWLMDQDEYPIKDYIATGRIMVLWGESHGLDVVMYVADDGALPVKSSRSQLHLLK